MIFKKFQHPIAGLIGAQAGDSRTVSVTFPKRVKGKIYLMNFWYHLQALHLGPAVDLSGKEAIFDVKVLSVKSVTLPKWDEELAKTVRDGMTLEELNAEVLRL